MKKSKILVVIAVIMGMTTLVLLKIHRDSKTIAKLQADLSTTQQYIKEKEDSISKLQGDIAELKKSNDNLREDFKASQLKIQQMEQDVYFTPANVATSSHATQYHMSKALKGTPLEVEANTFVKAEKKYGVNALFLAGIVAQESGWGKSERAKYQNNLSGYAVYSRGAIGAYFNDWESSIMATAKLISEDYLNESGKYYTGKSSRAVNTHYCQVDGKADYTWSEQVDKIVNELVSKANNKFNEKAIRNSELHNKEEA